MTAATILPVFPENLYDYIMPEIRMTDRAMRLFRLEPAELVNHILAVIFRGPLKQMIWPDA